jgi:hypothetical protein
MRIAILAAVAVSMVGMAYGAEEKKDEEETRPQEMCPPMPEADRVAGFEPWSHKPHCRLVEVVEEKIKRNKTFCVFTRSGEKRGFSVLTTPEVAATMEKEASWAQHDKRSAQAPLSTVSGDLYEAKEAPGSGIGLFATTDIPEGKVFMIDLPTIAAMRDALEGLKDEDRQEMMWRGLLQLPKDTQTVTRYLSRTQDLSRSRDGDEVDQVLQTNSVGINLGTRDLHLGVFPESAVCFLMTRIW